MKILYIITQAELGGAQHYVLDLAKHFKGSIAAGQDAEALFSEAATQHIPTHRLLYLRREINPYFDFLAFLELIVLIKQLRPDIIHLNSSKAGVLGSLAGFLTRVKIVYTAHGFVFNEPLSKWKRMLYVVLERFGNAFRHHTITVSEADKTSALKYHIASPSQITTINNGILELLFIPRSQARAQLALPADQFAFGSIANFYPTKGLDVLINACSLLGKELLQKISVIIIGDGPKRHALLTLIEKHDLSETVKLVGHIQKASTLLKGFDAFILPSRKEGFPYAILEALQAGLPIITTNTGGIPEALGTAGILVPPDATTQLADAMEIIATRSSIREELTKKALAQRKRFSLDQCLEKTKHIYDIVTKNTPT